MGGDKSEVKVKKRVGRRQFIILFLASLGVACNRFNYRAFGDGVRANVQLQKYVPNLRHFNQTVTDTLNLAGLYEQQVRGKESSDFNRGETAETQRLSQELFVNLESIVKLLVPPINERNARGDRQQPNNYLTDDDLQVIASQTNKTDAQVFLLVNAISDQCKLIQTLIYYYQMRVGLKPPVFSNGFGPKNLKNYRSVTTKDNMQIPCIGTDDISEALDRLTKLVTELNWGPPNTQSSETNEN